MLKTTLLERQNLKFSLRAILTDLADVKPVNLESQVYKQLVHGSVAWVVFPASQIRPRRELVHKVGPGHPDTLRRKEKVIN